MYSRGYNIAVIALWLLTAGWLIRAKVLPPLLVGEPPSYQAILRTKGHDPEVGWTMRLNGHPMGWALSSTKRLPQRLTEIHSLVHFGRLPLEEVVPGWLRTPLEALGQPLGKISIDARSVLLIDPLGRLSSFQSSLLLPPAQTLVRLEGTIEGRDLEISVCSEGFAYHTEARLPPRALPGDSLGLQTHLPGLRTGQKWTVPAYSVFRPPNNPLEILEATVEGTEAIPYNDHTEIVHRVVYRSDPGLGLGAGDTPCGRLWVRRDGVVLIQEVILLDATITFIRLSDEATQRLRKKADADGLLNPDGPPPRAAANAP